MKNYAFMKKGQKKLKMTKEITKEIKQSLKDTPMLDADEIIENLNVKVESIR